MAPVDVPAQQSRLNSKRKLQLDSDTESDSEDGGVALQNDGFKVNEEYAQRFEHNKKREERQRCKRCAREGEEID